MQPGPQNGVFLGVVGYFYPANADENGEAVEIQQADEDGKEEDKEDEKDPKKDMTDGDTGN